MLRAAGVAADVLSLYPGKHAGVRNTVWLTIFSYIGQFVSFATTIYLTRMLGPEVFGVYALGTFWVSLLALRNGFLFGKMTVWPHHNRMR